MIYFNGKKWGKSFDALLSSKGIKADENEVREIEKLIQKGQDVYTNINPYASQIAGETVLVWDIDKEELDDLCYRLSEDV